MANVAPTRLAPHSSSQSCATTCCATTCCVLTACCTTCSPPPPALRPVTGQAALQRHTCTSARRMPPCGCGAARCWPWSPAGATACRAGAVVVACLVGCIVGQWDWQLVVPGQLQAAAHLAGLAFLRRISAHCWPAPQGPHRQLHLQGSPGWLPGQGQKTTQVHTPSGSSTSRHASCLCAAGKPKRGRREPQRFSRY